MIRLRPHSALFLLLALLLSVTFLPAQSKPKTINTPDKPTLTFDRCEAGKPLRIVAYGDTRFADPSITKGTNPRVRKWLAARIAEEKPSLLLLTGDTPFVGSRPDDWKIFQSESAPWRAANILQLPTIGNHEIRDNWEIGIKNYLDNFPAIDRHRFYSATCGPVEVISLDMTDRYERGSDQARWFVSQLEHIPPTTKFLFILFHMPWMADQQSQIFVDLPTKGSVYLRDLLEARLPQIKPRVLVVNGHIHNYERFERQGVEYLITGGGGAQPYPLYIRGTEDLYKDTAFPVYHYITMDLSGNELKATMWKVKDPDAPTLTVEAMDHFTLTAK